MGTHGECRVCGANFSNGRTGFPRFARMATVNCGYAPAQLQVVLDKNSLLFAFVCVFFFLMFVVCCCCGFLSLLLEVVAVVLLLFRVLLLCVCVCV